LGYSSNQCCEVAPFLWDSGSGLKFWCGSSSYYTVYYGNFLQTTLKIITILTCQRYRLTVSSW
jgi:hypothetical protein